jgi:hypothetical protein
MAQQHPFDDVTSDPIRETARFSALRKALEEATTPPAKGSITPSPRRAKWGRRPGPVARRR